MYVSLAINRHGAKGDEAPHWGWRDFMWVGER